MAARLLRLWVRIPPGTWMFICCECCVLSGRSLCDEMITRPEEFYRLWCVVVCDLENLVNKEALAHWGAVAPKTNKQTNKHSALVNFMQVSDDRFQAEPEWNCSSILALLGSGHQKPEWNLPVPNVRTKLLMMDRENARNM